MKRKVFNKKLNLNKETVSRLNQNEMGSVKGGYTRYCHGTFVGCEEVPTTVETAETCQTNYETCGICPTDTNPGETFATPNC